MRRTAVRRRSAPALFAASLLLWGCAENVTGAVPPESDPVTVADSAAAAGRPFFHGAFLGDDVSNPEQIDGAVRQFGAMVGKQPALVKTFHPVSCDFTATGWCGRVLRRVAGTGATNYVALDLKWDGAPQTGVLETIVGGRADAEFARIARQLATVEGTVLLEPAWEMNGNWNYTWQGVANGADRGAPARYAQAWRRIVDVFRREGATNVRWVFNPNVGNPLTGRDTGPSHWNWYGHYYPGDAYVDYVGAHGFNAPKVWGGPWQDFSTMVDGAAGDRMLSDLEARYPGKPIIIGEFASDEGTPDQKAAWIRGAFERMRAHPAVVGAVWFHMKKEADWRIDSTPSALAAYRDALRDPGIRTAFQDVVATPAARLASQ
jgi:endoglucanase